MLCPIDAHMYMQSQAQLTLSPARQKRTDQAPLPRTRPPLRRPLPELQRAAHQDRQDPAGPGRQHAAGAGRVDPRGRGGRGAAAQHVPVESRGGAHVHGHRHQGRGGREGARAQDGAAAGV